MLRFAVVIAAISLFPVAIAQQNTPPPAAASASAPAPLPGNAIRDLMLDVERNQHRFDEARRDYIYHVHAVEEDFDSKSNVKKTTVTDSESLSIDGIRVDKVLAKNGHPLTPDEQKKESDRIDKEVAKARERRAKNQGKGRETDAEGHELLTVSRILELGAFTNPRRIDLDGRPAILLDYAGDPHAKTKNSFETVFKDLVGQVWIDEHDHVLVRGEGHFARDFKMGGGLVVDVHSGFHFEFRSTRINDEVWLPARIEAEGAARVLLFVHVRGHVTVTTSDYRKFRTSTTILPSNRLIGPDGQPLPDAPANPTQSTTPPN